VPRLLGVCVVGAVMLFTCWMLQNQDGARVVAAASLSEGKTSFKSATNTSSSTSASANGGVSESDALPANSDLVANGILARSLALNRHAAVFLTSATAPNRLFALSKSAAFPSGVALTPVAGSGASGFLGDGGAALSAQLDLESNSPVERSGIAIAADGTIFIADSLNGTIRSIAAPTSSEPGVIRSIAGRWGPRQNIALSEPMGIALDNAGNLFIADRTSSAIFEMMAGSSELKMLAHVISPASLAITPDGLKLFVASPQTGAVFSINTQTHSIALIPGFAPTVSGPIPESSTATDKVDACLSEDPAATTATKPSAPADEVVCPAGLAVDGASNLFVADANGGQILKIDGTTNKTTVAESGLETPGASQFDAEGNLFVAEQGLNRLIRIRALGSPASAISLSPASAGFPSVPVGTATSAQTFTLANNSTGTVSGLTISIAGADPGDFTIQNTNCGATLAANSTCNISVASTPHVAGSRSATLTVTDLTTSDLATANLYTLSLTPAVGTYSNEPVGGNGPAQTFTLTNSSPSAVTGVTIGFNPSTTPGNFTEQSTSCTSILAANSSCAITVAFTPQTTGALTGSLTVSESGGASVSSALNGTGDDFSLQLASGQPQEITIMQGGAGTVQAQVVPVGAFGQNGEKVTFNCPTNLPINTSCQITPCPATVAANTPTPFQILLMTSTNKAPAPAPTGKCSSYGPPPSALIVPAGSDPTLNPSLTILDDYPALGPWRQNRATIVFARAFTTRLHGSSGIMETGNAKPFLLLISIALLATTFLAMRAYRVYDGVKHADLRVGLVAIALFTLALTGCHKKNGSIVGSATPTGATVLTVTGSALDANGNSLGASRTLQFTVNIAQ
jgi:sugar lactone lactonase YvrE